MNRYLKKIFSSDKKRLFFNFFSLSSVQAISYILPLITVPYLVRVIGINYFGLISFAQGVIQYFVIFTGFGFGFSATKQIAQNRNNKKIVSKIFSSVLITQILISLISLILLTILVFSINKFKLDWEIFYLTFGIVIGQAIFPVWYFQGIEKMHIVALINIIPKIFFTVCIFLFIKNTADYIYVPLINSIGFLLAGLISLWLAFKRFEIKFILPSLSDIVYQLKEGLHIFIGNLSANFLILNNTFLLGLLTNSTMVGYYSAVEKIIRPLTYLNRIIVNTIFPYLSNFVKVDAMKAYKFSLKVSFVVAIIMFFIGIILFIFSDKIIKLLFGSDFYYSIIILKIMAFIPLISSLINIYAVPNMILFNFKAYYSKILFSAFLLNIILSYILIKFFLAKGAAMSSLLTDIIILISMSLFLKKKIKGGFYDM